MSRYRIYTRLDDAPELDGDGAFIKINEVLDGSSLSPGEVSRAVNKRLRRRILQTRSGVFNPAFSRNQPLNQIFGSDVFRDPNGFEWQLHAVSDGVVVMRDNFAAFKISLPEGETIQSRATFTQAFNVVLLFREKKSTLFWDGDVLKNFQEIPNPTNPAKIRIPNATHGLHYANRLLVPFGDSVAVSDILDYGQYDPIYNEARINQGSDDAISRLIGWTQNRVVVLKEQSIHVVNNFYGDLSQITQEQISSTVGCVAPWSVIQVEGDIIFLSEGGVRKLSQVIQDQAEDSSMSFEMESVMDRINWKYVAQATADWFEGYYRLAVPIDGSTFNNAVLLYNTNTGSWEGYDQIHPDAKIQYFQFYKADFNGKKRLYCSCNRTEENGCILLMDEGKLDHIGDETFQIIDRVITRKYTLGSTGMKQFNRVLFWFQTWNPFISIIVRRDGEKEPLLIAPIITKDRKKYTTHGIPDYDTTNINDDHAKPDREDYSVESINPLYNIEGIDFFKKQQHIEAFDINVTAAALAFEIVNSRGVCDLMRVQVEGPEADRSTKTQA